MVEQDGSPINSRVSEFAWHLKNYIRPRGLRSLGFPCQLMGTGMAFPWVVLRKFDLASDSSVEDLKLGLELALAGHAPVFCPFPGVRSTFPHTVNALTTQRLRWEQGHLGTILRLGPRLFAKSIGQRNLDLLVLSLDLAVPPLTLLGMLVIASYVIAGLAALAGISSTPFLVNSANLAALLITLFAAWLKFGRQMLPPRQIILIVPFVFRNAVIYWRILSQRYKPQWTRTERTKI